MTGEVLRARTSALDPAGPAAAAIADLSWWMIALFGLYFLLVMGILCKGVFSLPQEEKAPLHENRFIIGWGLFFPGLIVVGLILYSLFLTARLRADEAGFPVRIVGKMWWWEVQYPSAKVTSANEIYIPVGKPVRIELVSDNVIHSLWVPSLAGKIDLIPGHDNYITLEASEPGVFRGQCAEYCGLQHARMSLYIVALHEDEFERWIEERQRPVSPKTAKGPALFRKHGCFQCHAIRGEGGTIGPDLTHIGSRLSLGAGTIPNSFGNLAGWIADPQSLKPGNHMPRTYLPPEDLQTLTTYLMELR